MKLIYKLLLTVLISVTATAKASEQAIIKKGQPAPYKGVLVQEDIYRDMFYDISAKDSFQKSLGECTTEYKNFKEAQSEKELYFFGGGAALGLVLGLLAVK